MTFGPCSAPATSDSFPPITFSSNGGSYSPPHSTHSTSSSRQSSSPRLPPSPIRIPRKPIDPALLAATGLLERREQLAPPDGSSAWFPPSFLGIPSALVTSPDALEPPHQLPYAKSSKAVRMPSDVDTRTEFSYKGSVGSERLFAEDELLDALMQGSRCREETFVGYRPSPTSRHKIDPESDDGDELRDLPPHHAARRGVLSVSSPNGAAIPRSHSQRSAATNYSRVTSLTPSVSSTSDQHYEEAVVSQAFVLTGGALSPASIVRPFRLQFPVPPPPPSVPSTHAPSIITSRHLSQYSFPGSDESAWLGDEAALALDEAAATLFRGVSERAAEYLAETRNRVASTSSPDSLASPDSPVYTDYLDALDRYSK